MKKEIYPQLKYYRENIANRKEYYRNNSGKISIYGKDYYEANKKKKNAYVKGYREANSIKVKEWAATYQRKGAFAKFEKNDYAPRRFADYKCSAKKRGHSFELTFEQFISFWKKPCAYGGCVIETIGLDRVDNLKGYTMKNIVPCCKIHNKMKRDLSREEFIFMCQKAASAGLEKK